MADAETEYVFRIDGLDCAEEVAILKRAVGPVVGGEDRLAFDILNRRMIVAPVLANVSAESIRQAVARTGMRAEGWRDTPAEPRDEGFWKRRGRTARTAASGFLTALGFLVHVWAAEGFQAALGSEGLGAAHNVPLAARAIYSLGILAGAWYVLPKAWFAARRLRPDMNLLMTIAILGD